MPETKPIPAGFVATRSGVIVKKSVAMEATANSQFGWQMVGLDDPEKRGEDRADFKYERLLKEIETSRRRDPIIFRAVDYFDKLALGTGVTLSSENADVLRAADAFWAANDLDDGQHEMSTELVTTGNLFAHVPEQFDGDIPVLQLIPTAQIDRIATKDGAPWYYRRKWTELVYPEPKKGVMDGRSGLTPTPKTRQQDIPAAEMVHVGINRAAGELRGVSAVEPAIYWSALYGRGLETGYATAVARAMIAYHGKIANTNSDELTKLKDLIESQLVTRTDSRGQAYKAMGTGQILWTGDNVDMSSLGNDLRAGTSDPEIRRILLMAATAFGLPEFSLSDGDSTNRATGQSQSDPFFRLMQSHQATLLRAMRRIFAKVFDRYQVRKQFRSLAPPEGKSHVSDWLTLSAPEMLEPNLAELAPAAELLVAAGLWSKEYANQRMGSNWDTMKKQIVSEREEGFAPVVPQPAPPLGGPSPFPLSFSAEEVRHEETETPVQKKKRITKEVIAQFVADVKASKGDKDKIADAKAKAAKQLKTELNDLIDLAREMGVESVAA